MLVDNLMAHIQIWGQVMKRLFIINLVVLLAALVFLVISMLGAK
jgi:hypothetical protein